ncbi:hypothetical protein P4H66_06960 [Paenibacillus dokdonensis]|uniref:Uncharacterized protein n=1 Tax=Paenibacillus dokdonensis TaxID=2567944 RepID=A0ABU6GIN4_9BACL|nr:hypothetical protein [Paenibacillus dokdonensis]MEC0239597.1 hypothetical protein [Paenibacillus dokdonensis]
MYLPSFSLEGKTVLVSRTTADLEQTANIIKDLVDSGMSIYGF